MPPLLGSLYGLLIWLALSSGLFVWLKQSADAIKLTAAASQTQVMADAFSRYVRDHSADIAATSTATVPVTITVNQLRGNYVSASTPPTGIYGQTFVAQSLQPIAGKLLTMMFTTGGTQLPTRTLVPLATQSTAKGILGGFVPYANQLGDTSMQPTIAVGVGGSFRQSLANFFNPGSGHLAMMLNVTDVQADNGYLYRVDMKPNRPDLNAMQTDLSMTDTGGTAHDINGIGTVNAVAGKFSGNIGTAGFDPQAGLPAGYAGGVHTWDVYAEGTIAAGNQGKLNASMDYLGHIVGQQLSLANAAVPNTSCTNYGVNATSISANADGSGQILSCQLNGQGARWMPIGGPILRYGYFTVADSSFVPAPNCPSGAQQLLQLSLQGFTVNQTATVNGGPATWTGNGWIVHMQDGAGNSLPGTATVGTYCYYGT
ncbi:shufflon system plasmid conjugative transfer pilus tip adhesin PilV [Burkholderia gladioli]|uniref:shufflon system plasmid conjugative transfer pilus tip adhesin PilV n=1 Tax=Burkholderia gladioli TaxID=28095 RepID=UPI00164054FC|nr:shufflon system plasmid conjugative transfer pilus tip adhesin PilV [Burkholderia gladioli]